MVEELVHISLLAPCSKPDIILPNMIRERIAKFHIYQSLHVITRVTSQPVQDISPFSSIALKSFADAFYTLFAEHARRTESKPPYLFVFNAFRLPLKNIFQLPIQLPKELIINLCSPEIVCKQINSIRTPGIKEIFIATQHGTTYGLSRTAIAAISGSQSRKDCIKNAYQVLTAGSVLIIMLTQQRGNM